MPKDPDLDKIHEANLHVALQERSGAMEAGILVSEVTGRHGWKVECHHILGRNKPKGFKNLPPIIQEFWPHIPFLCVLLTTAEHKAAGDNSKMMKPLLLAWILVKYGREEWQGRQYWEWLFEPPAIEYLREVAIEFLMPRILVGGTV